MAEAKEVSDIKCDDKNCPKHGKISLRGNSFTGKVIKSKMMKSCVIEWERRVFVPKYERYEKKRTRIKAHNPPCINAKEGDMVLIQETRPISKTINFAVIKILGKDNESD